MSHSSIDSAGDEFVVVNAEPKLKIANNGDVNELEQTLSEVLTDQEHQEAEEGTSVADRMAASDNMTSSGVEIKVQEDQEERSPEVETNPGYEGMSH